MDSNSVPRIVAMPVPSRGSINPMMCLCRLLARRGVRIIFVVTEEWEKILESDSGSLLSGNIRVRTIPNVVPSERIRANNFEDFVEGVRTKLEAPFEELIDGLDSPVDGILADSFLRWSVGLGRRKGIKVFSVFTQSAAVFTVFWHYDLFQAHVELPVDLSERGNECVDFIPGIEPNTTLSDLHSICFNQTFINVVLECFPFITKAHCVLFPFSQEIEPQTVAYLKANFPVPIYTVGPLIPFMNNNNKLMSLKNKVSYINEWLNSKAKSSVLYVSLGSLHSPSQKQMEEIAKALRYAGISYLWVVRQNTCDVDALIDKKKGLLVPWCEQLDVLCHPSIGGFFSHCGWNSTLETLYAGVPVLAFPLTVDQFSNTKLIVDDLKVGIRLRRQSDNESDSVTMSEDMAKSMRMLMDFNRDESKVLRRRAEEMKNVCQGAVRSGGSSFVNLDAFLKDMINQSR